jgi:heme-degrading monooxygenase HmoA
MAVFVRITNHGVGPELYDQIAKQLIPALQARPGFRYHFAYADGGGLVVNEIWDSRERQAEWFDAAVRPNLPPGAEPSVDVIDLHNAVGP